MLSAIRNFFITLICALILLGTVGYLITDFALGALNPSAAQPIAPEDTRPGALDTLPETGGDVRPPIVSATDESFTMLLIGHDYQPDVFEDYDRTDETNPTAFPLPPRQISADMLIVLHVDQKTDSVFLCNIPTNARISDMGLTTSLGALYGKHGAQYLADRVTSLIGLNVDYYVSVGIPGLIELIDEIGGITYHVPQDMYYYDDVEDFTISLTKGEQTLSGQKAIQLLRFNSYEDDGTARRETAIGVLKAVMAKVASDRDYYDNALLIYDMMKVHVETNFTQTDAARKLDLIFRYNEMTVSSAQYPGRSVKVETVVIPETTEPVVTPSPELPPSPETGTNPDPGIPPETTGPATSEPTTSEPQPPLPEIIVTYYYELDYVNGRALFSAYKYTG